MELFAPSLPRSSTQYVDLESPRSKSTSGKNTPGTFKCIPTKRSPCRFVKNALFALLHLHVHSVGHVTANALMGKDSDHSFRSETTGTAHGFDCVLDSGASDHFCNDISMFDDMHDVHNRFVKVANGKRIHIQKAGTIRLRLCNQYGEIKTFVLKDVAFVPSFSHTLLSVRMLWKKHRLQCKMGKSNVLKSLDGDKFSFLDQDGLFRMSAFNTEQTIDPNILHQRFGHCGIDKLKLCPNRVNGVSFPSDLSFSHCEACKQGGAVSHSFPKSTVEHAMQFGDKVSTDLVDMGVLSHDGYRYIICFVDRATRFLHIDLLKDKSPEGVMAALKKYQNTYSAYLQNGHIKRWHCDNGGEFTSDDLNAFCEEFAIKRSFSVPYAPQQNAQAERIWGVLLRRMRTMMAQFDVPDTFWTECATQAALIHNILPSKSMTGFISPHQALHGTLPDASMLRVWGCKCYVKLEPHDRPNKLAPTAVNAIHLGVDPQRNGFRVYIPAFDRFTSSTHIQFVESEKLSWTADDVGVKFGPSLRVGADKLDKSTDDLSKSTDGNLQNDISGDADGVARQNIARRAAENILNDEVQRNPMHVVLNPTPSHAYSSRSVLNRDLRSGLWERVTAGKCVIVESACECAFDFVDEREQIALNVYAFGSFDDVGPISIPNSYEEAMASRFAHKWLEAMRKEVEGLMENDTWDVCPRDVLKGRNAIKSKWVYTIKYNRDGTIERFKARFVACGYSQIPEKDFDRSFSSTLSATSIRLLCSIAAQRGLQMEHLDVKNAFVQSPVEEGRQMFVEPPKGFCTPNTILLLKRSLYGTRQASRMWQQTLANALLEMDFKRCPTDPCLYVLSINGETKMILGVYVDDIICLHKSDGLFEKFTSKFWTRFTGKHIGKLDWFLGIGVDQNSDGVFLSQTKYIEEVCERFIPGVSSRSVLRDVPCVESQLSKLALASDDVERERAGKLPYLALVGSLLYISTMTRPDVAYAIGQLCQFMHDPSPECYEVGLNVLLYLYKTRNLRLAFKSVSTVPKVFGRFAESIRANAHVFAFTDASWGAERPVYGYVVCSGTGPVSWVSKKLRSAESSCEAEYAAAYHGAKELVFVRNVLEDLGFPLARAVVCGVDNSAAIDVAMDRGVTARTKHFARVLHLIREHIDHQFLHLHWVSTADQMADIFTKCLDKTAFLRVRNMLFVV